MCGTIGSIIIFHKVKVRSGVLSIDVVKDAVNNKTVLFSLLIRERGLFENLSHILLMERLI